MLCLAGRGQSNVFQDWGPLKSVNDPLVVIEKLTDRMADRSSKNYRP